MCKMDKLIVFIPIDTISYENWWSCGNWVCYNFSNVSSQSDQKTRKFFIFPDFSLADNTLCCYTLLHVTHISLTLKFLIADVSHAVSCSKRRKIIIIIPHRNHHGAKYGSYYINNERRRAISVIYCTRVLVGSGRASERTERTAQWFIESTKIGISEKL